MRNKTSTMLAVLVCSPGAALAHHGAERDVAGQLMHSSFDPLHLGISVLVAYGLYGLLKLYRRTRSGQ